MSHPVKFKNYPTKEVIFAKYVDPAQPIFWYGLEDIVAPVHEWNTFIEPDSAEFQWPIIAAPVSLDSRWTIWEVLTCESSWPIIAAPVSLDSRWPIMAALVSLDSRWPIIAAPVSLDSRWPIIAAPVSLDSRWPIIAAPVSLDSRWIIWAGARYPFYWDMFADVQNPSFDWRIRKEYHVDTRWNAFIQTEAFAESIWNICAQVSTLAKWNVFGATLFGLTEHDIKKVVREFNIFATLNKEHTVRTLTNRAGIRIVPDSYRHIIKR